MELFDNSLTKLGLSGVLLRKVVEGCSVGGTILDVFDPVSEGLAHVALIPEREVQGCSHVASFVRKLTLI